MELWWDLPLQEAVRMKRVNERKAVAWSSSWWARDTRVHGFIPGSPEASLEPAWCWLRGNRATSCQRHRSCPHLNTGDFQMHLSNLDTSPDSRLESPVTPPHCHWGDKQGPETQHAHSPTLGLSPNPSLSPFMTPPSSRCSPKPQGLLNPLFSPAPTLIAHHICALHL